MNSAPCEAHAHRLLQVPAGRLAAAVAPQDVAPGAFGENVRVEEFSGSAWDAASLCIGQAG